MTDHDLRSALTSTLETLEKVVAQVNEATISAHAIRMAIAQDDPEMTVRIHQKYLELTNSTQPSVDQVTSAIRGIVRTLNS